MRREREKKKEKETVCVWCVEREKKASVYMMRVPVCVGEERKRGKKESVCVRVVREKNIYGKGKESEDKRINCQRCKRRLRRGRKDEIEK